MSRFTRADRRSIGLSLSLILFVGCSAPLEDVEIPFVARFGDSPVSCDSDVEGLALTDLRLYVHDIRLLTAGNEEQALLLVEDPLWQNSEVALLDFENGKGRCTNGTEQTNDVVRGRAPPGTYTGLRFRLGVPEHLNHADPLRAAAPLNYSFMHWHWLTGYKFLRAGLATEDDGFWLHLGGSRCERTSDRTTVCRAGNRPSVELSPYAAGDVVELDLEELVNGIDLDDGTPSDCSSGPAEDECRMPFTALGIDFRTGNPIGTTAVFRVGPRQ